jgi:hypothetical protein
MDHQLQQLLDLGLETQGFFGVLAHRGKVLFMKPACILGRGA